VSTKWLVGTNSEWLLVPKDLIQTSYSINAGMMHKKWKVNFIIDELRRPRGCGVCKQQYTRAAVCTATCKHWHPMRSPGFVGRW